MAHFQQDGHMAMRNPKGRANYEPNSWGPTDGGPREDPVRGFRSFAATEEGPKARLRPESFADHYSQARLFYMSQERIEQKHIADALVFELSKVERPDIRSRTVSHLRNIDEKLAATVADGLGLDLPKPAKAARPTQTKLPLSAALSILKQGAPGFKGRKLGIYVTDGTDASLFNGLVAATESAGAVYEVVAPKIGGVVLSDGTAVAAKQKIDGGPSVLFDAVAILPSAAGAELIAGDAASQDFARDAFGHCKYIGYTAEAAKLFEKAGLKDELDSGCLKIGKAADAKTFIAACSALRFWEREMKVDLDAKA
jgi:catalase